MTKITPDFRTIIDEANVLALRDLGALELDMQSRGIGYPRASVVISNGSGSPVYISLSGSGLVPQGFHAPTFTEAMQAATTWLHQRDQRAEQVARLKAQLAALEAGE